MKNFDELKSSLVKFIGVQKNFSQTEMAEAANVGVIPLQHHRKTGRGKIGSVGGFQGCVIMMKVLMAKLFIVLGLTRIVLD
jgi:hypothetical protein